MLIACALTCGATLLADDAPPTSEPALTPQQKRKEDAYFRVQRAGRENQRKQHEALPEAPPVDGLDSLVKLGEENGRLLAKIVPPAVANPQARVKVKGIEAAFEVHTRGSFVARGGRPATALQRVTRYEFEPASDDAFWSIVLDADADAGFVSIHGQGFTSRSSFVQDGEHVTFSAFRRDRLGVFHPLFRASADSFRELRAAHPREFEDLVIPVLARFSDLPFLRPGPAEVYRVFPGLAADASVTERVIELIPGLAADTFPERDAASHELSELGPAGVLAIMRLDPDQLAELTDEQRSRLTAIVTASGRLSPSFSPQAALKDARFLADCLEDVDLAVRTAAKSELEKLLGHSIDFDPASEGGARANAVATLRKTLPRRPEPTTQPVTVADQPQLR